MHEANEAYSLGDIYFVLCTIDRLLMGGMLRLGCGETRLGLDGCIGTFLKNWYKIGFIK